jgi:hypothetical protein
MFHYYFLILVAHNKKLTNKQINMKNKLITTALTSSLLAVCAGSAIAQTTISGNLDITYNAVSADTNTVTGNSYRGFGKEAQINISNKGKLSNGIGYAAGFSWEIDGPDTLVEASALENNYIDFIFNNGATTLSLSVDHVNTSDQTLVNPVGFGYVGGAGIANSSSIYPNNLADNNSLGVAVEHNFGPLKATINYMPNAEQKYSNDVANSYVSTQVENATNSKKTFVLQGDLGVKGLNVLAVKTIEDAEINAANTAAVDKDGTRYSIGYNFGQLTVAADKIESKGQNATRSGTAATLGNETLKGQAIGLAYAIDKDLSIGIFRAKAETSLTSAPEDEKIMGYTVGYNLGAVTVQAQYRDIENVAGVAANDGKIGGIKVSTKF